MATYELKNVSTVLTGGTDTLYTVPAGKKGSIRNVSLTNMSGGIETVDVKFGTSGSEKFWRKAISLDVGATVEFNGIFGLDQNQVLKMIASAASAIDVGLTYIEETP